MNSAAASVFHLHPLQRCNLQCRHCYSDSSPRSTALIAPERALAAVTAAAHWGYAALAVSGGEPMLFPGLSTLLAHGAGLGMNTSVVTNGLLCRTRKDIDTLRHADTVTVSLDGLEPQHDRMRARKGAYSGAANAVQRMADAGMQVWVAYGVTAENVADIAELADNASRWGARGMTCHVVEAAGRAANLPETSLLTLDARVLLYVTATVLAAGRVDGFDLRIDLVHRDTILREPGLLYAYANPMRPALVAQAVRVLVMMPDGMLLPVCYGFNARYAVGQFAEASNANALWDAFFTHSFPELTALATASLEALRQDEQQQVINPGDWLAQRSLADSVTSTWMSLR